jgi:hypothetical protein
MAIRAEKRATHPRMGSNYKTLNSNENRWVLKLQCDNKVPELTLLQ